MSNVYKNIKSCILLVTYMIFLSNDARSHEHKKNMFHGQDIRPQMSRKTEERTDVCGLHKRRSFFFVKKAWN